MHTWRRFPLAAHRLAAPPAGASVTSRVNKPDSFDI